jgi:lipopolysaccharide export system protein LptA
MGNETKKITKDTTETITGNKTETMTDEKKHIKGNKNEHIDGNEEVHVTGNSEMKCLDQKIDATKAELTIKQCTSNIDLYSLEGKVAKMEAKLVQLGS